MKRMPLTTIAASLLLTASTALAQNTPTFDELDQDGDGYISANEAMVLPCLAENFDRIEFKDDRGLDESEYTTAVNQYCQQSDSEWPAV